MKELFAISYYNSTNQSLNFLRELVLKIKSNDKNFIISGHSSIPQDIIDLSDGYLYDKENLLIKREKNGSSSWVSLQDGSILHSPYFGYTSQDNHCPACIKNVINMLNYGYGLGFNLIHVIDYDVMFDDFIEFDINNKLMESSDYNVIMYKNDQLFGPYVTYKIEKYIDRFNLDILLEKLEKSQGQCEEATSYLYKDWFGEDKVFFHERWPDFKHRVKSFSRKPNFCLFESNERIYIYLENTGVSKIKNIIIYTKYLKIELDELTPGIYTIWDIAQAGDFVWAHLYSDNILIQKFDIQNQSDYESMIKCNYLQR